MERSYIVKPFRKAREKPIQIVTVEMVAATASLRNDEKSRTTDAIGTTEKIISNKPLTILAEGGP